MGWPSGGDLSSHLGAAGGARATRSRTHQHRTQRGRTSHVCRFGEAFEETPPPTPPHHNNSAWPCAAIIMYFSRGGGCIHPLSNLARALLVDRKPPTC